jgi:hypothetical protein
VAKTNYNLAKRQKEAARKTRQQEKLAKKLARVAGEPGAEGEPVATTADPVPVPKEGP